MKKIAGFIVFATLLAAGCVMYVPNEGAQPVVTTPPDQAPAQDIQEPEAVQNDANPDDYYGTLQPYGLWVSYAPYGYVWLPRNVSFGWRPYALGRWILTDDGWAWDSAEHWGWLVYHYGRWGWDIRLGWYWVPGNVWGPAWVAWRWGDAYIGWAPLPPGAEFFPGRGFLRREFDIPGHYWNFVRGHDFMDRSVDRWIFPAERNVTFINTTVYNVNIHESNHHIINDGVAVDHVRRVTNQPVERHVLQDARRPGEARVEGQDVMIYRPNIHIRQDVRPKEVLDRDQAARRIEAGPGAAGPRRTSVNSLSSLQQTHDQERRLMQQSQQEEVNAARNKAEADKRNVRSLDDKRKIDQGLKTRLADIKQKQDTEKAKLAARQKAEVEKAKKPPVKDTKTEKH